MIYCNVASSASAMCVEGDEHIPELHSLVVLAAMIAVPIANLLTV